jgi:hypothetical protein
MRRFPNEEFVKLNVSGNANYVFLFYVLLVRFVVDFCLPYDASLTGSLYDILDNMNHPRRGHF